MGSLITTQWEPCQSTSIRYFNCWNSNNYWTTQQPLSITPWVRISRHIAHVFSHTDYHSTCRNPILRKCEDETHTPEMGTWESFGIPETSEFDCRGQNTLHWGVLYIIEKLSKCRCWKCACMNHLDIWNTSYGKMKSQESKWQFDSRPLKVRNRPNLDAYSGSATHR
jgi:hypothetical protein